MSQIKIYGLKDQLASKREQLSETIHSCVMDALGLPKDKRAHRFILLEKENFFMPGGRTDAYTIIEISMIEGRTADTKKKLIRLLLLGLNLVLFQNLQRIISNLEKVEKLILLLIHIIW